MQVCERSPARCMRTADHAGWTNVQSCSRPLRDIDYASSGGSAMKRSLLVAAATLAAGLSTAALADECSGRSHTGGTVAGAAGGALIGGLAGNSAGAAVAGGVLGGLTGNAIARRSDC